MKATNAGASKYIITAVPWVFIQSELGQSTLGLGFSPEVLVPDVGTLGQLLVLTKKGIKQGVRRLQMAAVHFFTISINFR